MTLKVVGLRRFPVKSMLGEEHDRLEFDATGAVGDRRWALRCADGKLGSGKNHPRFRRIPGLLEHHAAYDDEGLPVITAPDGATLCPGDPRIPERFGDGVELVREGEAAAGSEAGSAAGPEGHKDVSAVSLIGTASLRALGDLLGDADPVDVRRLRKNIVVETDEPWIEESWIGREIVLGGGHGTEPLRLRGIKRVKRCVMVTQAQPGLPADNRVLKTLTAARGMCIGIHTDVVTPAPLALGDTVAVR
ncbi:MULTISPECIES: MOSC domain-containing protein [Streptomyces]|uniref:MOSC domain-containing protein n=1 Tax=Streptomyces TaxID=1883 RepID=UPI001E51E95E|nr:MULTISPECIES: MOSC N-terminal beta barrel domain-containing protein [Streptomyces]UFQ16107.1 MOSC domain-containing protein [Streptomyces huasconensis]WCL85711.1 MOSC domain-containing protein [Streptomyces sp. JCM 35825]